MTEWTAQDKVLAVVPKFSGLLSLCGSIYIAQHVLRSRERRNFVYHRILCAMSCSDILGSSMYVLSTWPIPRGYAVYAAGNQATCNFSGTLDQFASLTTPLFSGSLSIYYLLVIRYGWREERVQKYQSVFFLIPFLLGSGTAIAGLFMKLYNPADWVCWIAPFPPGCEDDSPTNPCTRGINADLYRMVFSYAIVWVVFGVLAISMLLIYLKVRATELRIIKYRSSSFRLQQRPSEDEVLNNRNRKIFAANPQCPDNNLLDEADDNQDFTSATNLEQKMSEGSMNGNHDEDSQPKGAVQVRTQPAPPPTNPRYDSNNRTTEATASDNNDNKSGLNLEEKELGPSDGGHDSQQPKGENALRVRIQEQNPPSHSPPAKKKSLSRTVMVQAILYMSAFYLTFIFGTIARLLQIWNITLYPIFVCMTIFFPLQGFWQFLIYTRPARLKRQEKQRQRQQEEPRRRNNNQGRDNHHHRNHHDRDHHDDASCSSESSSTYTQNPLLCIDLFNTTSSGQQQQQAAAARSSNDNDDRGIHVGGSNEPPISSTAAVHDSLVYANHTFDDAESELEYISSCLAN